MRKLYRPVCTDNSNSQTSLHRPYVNWIDYTKKLIGKVEISDVGDIFTKKKIDVPVGGGHEDFLIYLSLGEEYNKISFAKEIYINCGAQRRN